MDTQLQAVITANRERQVQARQLNVRSGQKLFPVLTRTELEAWVTEKIADARSVREIPSLELLRLPTLDQSLVDNVVRENPESIEVLGHKLAVEYRDGYQPKVTLKLESVEDITWRQLPDDEIKLPGGRSIELTISFGWYDSVSGTDIPKLKAQMRERLNRKQWDSWQKPVIVLPDLASTNVVIPNITIAQYGTCVVEGTPLTAYGVAAVNPHRYYSSDPWFEGKWYWDKYEADKAHAQAVQKLEAIRVEEQQKRELERAKTEAETARQTLRDMSSHEGWQMLDSTLRRKIEDWRYSYLPSSTVDLQQDKAKTEAILAEVEAGLAELQRFKEDSARAVASGEILVNFEAWHRRGGMTSNGEGWVIRADGTRRERDNDDVRRHKSDGNYRWEHVLAPELALRWSCGHMGDVAGNSTFEVAKVPLTGCTKEQLEAVRQIEEEIGAPEGAFGLDPEVNRRNHQRLDAIRAAATKVLDSVIPEFSYLQVAGQNGVVVEANNRLQVNWAEPFNDRCDARDAQVVRNGVVADGMLEFLAYDKYGQMNFSMRWRPLREDDMIVTQPEPTTQVGSFTDVGNRWFKCSSGHTMRVDKAEWSRYQQGEAISLGCGICGSTGTVKR